MFLDIFLHFIIVVYGDNFATDINITAIFILNVSLLQESVIYWLCVLGMLFECLFV